MTTPLRYKALSWFISADKIISFAIIHVFILYLFVDLSKFISKSVIAAHIYFDKKQACQMIRLQKTEKMTGIHHTLKVRWVAFVGNLKLDHTHECDYKENNLGNYNIVYSTWNFHKLSVQRSNSVAYIYYSCNSSHKG